MNSNYNNKKVLITFLGNLNYDTRCKNLFDTLSTSSFEVEFIGFDWLTKNFVEINDKISIFKLKKGFLSISFYLKFIWHLKLKLLTTKASTLFAEDIYTLPFVVIFGKGIQKGPPSRFQFPIYDKQNSFHNQ